MRSNERSKCDAYDRKYYQKMQWKFRELQNANKDEPISKSQDLNIGQVYGEHLQLQIHFVILQADHLKGIVLYKLFSTLIGRKNKS